MYQLKSDDLGWAVVTYSEVRNRLVSVSSRPSWFTEQVLGLALKLQRNPVSKEKKKQTHKKKKKKEK